MKIALVHDHLTCKAGGEQVALAFHRAFPKAPIYTLAYNREDAFPEFKDCDIRTSWFQKISSKENTVKKLFFPLGILAMRSLYLGGYDVVLISGTHCGKYVRTSPGTVRVSYTFTPFRLAWNPSSYSQYEESTGLKRAAFNIVIRALKMIDFHFAKKVDFFLAMTQETSERIEKAYKPSKKISIINPPVNNLERFKVNPFAKKEYYLVVSRLEYYKRVDLVVKAFNVLKKPLVIVGRGVLEEELKGMNRSERTQFMKDLSLSDLVDLYENCKAFIFPQHEDYGLTALEANAAGRPVIGYAKGGLIDTQIPFVKNSVDMSLSTAIFFENQTPEELIEKVREFETFYSSFSPSQIRRHAERFSEDKFVQRIQDIVREFVNAK